MRFVSLFCVAVVAVAVAGCPAATGEGEGEGEAGEGEGEEGEGEDLVEVEPNGGTPVQAVNDLPVGAVMSGSIDGADDADVFHVTGTVAGHAYRATLDAAAAGGLGDGKLAVLDDGRNDEAAGADYVRVQHAPAGPGVVVEFVALGGGVFVAVEDEGSGGGWTLRIEDVTAAVTGAALASPTTRNEVLAGPGSVLLLPFDATAGSDVVFDVVAADLDCRLFVVSTSVGDWIARNDDRSVGDVNPLIDAPLFEEGPYLLLIENNEDAPATTNLTLVVP